jgi:hypothetical protein
MNVAKMCPKFTVIIFLRHWHRAQKVRGSTNGLSLILYEDFVHTHLLSPEGGLTSVGLQVQVHLHLAGRTDDLGGDGVHVNFLVKNVDVKFALKKNRKNNLS